MDADHSAGEGNERVGLTLDPWLALQGEEGERDGWLLSFVDLLTLMLTLMVVLLMLQHHDRSSGALARITKDETATVPAPERSLETQPPQQRKQQRAPAVLAVAEQRTVPPPPPVEQPLQEPMPLLRVNLPEMAEKEGERAPEGPAAPPPPQFAEPVRTPRAPQLPAVEPSQPAARSKSELAQAQPPPPFDPQPLLDVLKWRNLGDGVTLTTSETQLRLETKDSILFSNASTELSDGGRLLLRDLAGVLGQHPGAISVEGHADSRPIVSSSYPSNWELSSARAAGVVRFLEQQGLASERLRAIGYGATRPRADNGTLEGRAANRRVSLVLELRPPAQDQSPRRSHTPLM